MTPKTEAARDAERIRVSVWGDRYPVDPVRIARKLGIDVLDAKLRRDVSGALVKERGQDPTILLNEQDSANRKRFTCAHEIGHFVRREEDPDEYEYIDLRDTFAATGHDPEEVYANAFAASLLMPEKEVKRLRSQGYGELDMALYFDVSREAMHNRLKNLHLSVDGR
jgi:Zn-dependent peptidase ImmA (M78 family)